MQNYRHRQISLRTGLADMDRLEAFLDKICDDFHIYDDYYGNVIATMTAAYELIPRISDTPNPVEIHFRAGPAGVMFSILLDEDFLTLAAKLQKVKAAQDNIKGYGDLLQESDEADDLLMMMNLLSDDLQFDPETGSMEISFHITGINDMLSMQRTQLMHNYYERLHSKTKAQQ